MAHIRKSLDGRKRAKTMEYIDSQVDINDEDLSQSSTHVGQHIHAQFDESMSIIDEAAANDSTYEFEPMIRPNPSIPKVKKRDNERLPLQRQMSDISLNRFLENPSKNTTELKGRDHVLRAMKTTNSKPTTDYKNHKLIQEMIAKRHEKQTTNKPISDFAMNYGLVDGNGKQSKSRKSSEFIADMAQQLESLKPALTRRKAVDPNGPLLRVVKVKHVWNQLLCYCQYVNDREDVVLFFDPNHEQSKSLAVNDEIRIAGESRIDLNVPGVGSVAMGITDVQRDLVNNRLEVEIFRKAAHTYDFNCSCEKCHSNRDPVSQFDLRSTFSTDHNQQMIPSVESVYESFTLALMTTRKFDLYGTIIIFESDDRNHKYIFIVRDGIGNCLQIILTDIHGLPIEFQTRTYVFHQIEFVERIESPKESNRWPYEEYASPKKLFCFRSTHNRVSTL